MNQKDYKEIAEIIKKYKNQFLTLGANYKLLVKDLADYFEKEVEQKANIEQRVGNLVDANKIRKSFNREQFLKDCGVEE